MIYNSDGADERLVSQILNVPVLINQRRCYLLCRNIQSLHLTAWKVMPYIRRIFGMTAGCLFTSKEAICMQMIFLKVEMV